MNIALTLTEQETAGLIRCLEVAVRTDGLAAVPTVNLLNVKIQVAIENARAIENAPSKSPDAPAS